MNLVNIFESRKIPTMLIPTSVGLGIGQTGVYMHPTFY